MLQKSALTSVACAVAMFGHASATASGYESPAYYPAPHGGWVDEWRDSYSKAKKLVDSMTLAEKTNITAGTGIFMGELSDFVPPRNRAKAGVQRSCYMLPQSACDGPHD